MEPVVSPRVMMPVPAPVAAPRLTVPALIITPPEKVFVPESVNVPCPSLVNKFVEVSLVLLVAVMPLATVIKDTPDPPPR